MNFTFNQGLDYSMMHLGLIVASLISLAGDAPEGSLVTRPYWCPALINDYVYVVDDWVAPADRQSPEDRPVVAVDDDGLIQE